MPHLNLRLSQKQQKHLKKIYKTEKGKPSERAHIVLLYSQGYSIDEIARICLCDRKTVSSDLKRFQEKGFQGLYDNDRSGRPTILDQEDEQFLFSALEKCPSEFGYFATVWTIGLMLHLLRTKRRKNLSEAALKDLLHKRNWRFNRPKHIPPPPDPISEEEKAEILRLLNNPEEDEILLFGDESDIELLPYIGGAWMPAGKTLKIPTPGKNQILCCFGFFNPHDKKFYYKLVVSRTNRTAQNFIATLHQLRALFPEKRIHVVVDNASIHSESTKLLRRFRENYGHQVFIHFLPKRATRLNPIERFWEFLKQRIACNWLYQNLEALREAFHRFVWHYRDDVSIYNFDLGKLIRAWKEYPVIENPQPEANVA